MVPPKSLNFVDHRYLRLPAAATSPGASGQVEARRRSSEVRFDEFQLRDGDKGQLTVEHVVSSTDNRAGHAGTVRSQILFRVLCGFFQLQVL